MGEELLMHKLNEESFKEVERFVASKGTNYNQDRCFVIPIGFIEEEVTCCLDEIDSELRICQIDGKNTGFRENPFYSKKIIERSEKAAYNTLERVKYEEYKEVVKMHSKCCSKCEECCRGIVED